MEYYFAFKRNEVWTQGTIRMSVEDVLPSKISQIGKNTVNFCPNSMLNSPLLKPLYQCAWTLSLNLPWFCSLGNVLNRFSHVKLFATLWAIIRQAPLSMGFPRQEYWSGLPFLYPGHHPCSGIKPRSPALQTDSLPSDQTTPLWKRPPVFSLVSASNKSFDMILGDLGLQCLEAGLGFPARDWGQV